MRLLLLVILIVVDAAIAKPVPDKPCPGNLPRSLSETAINTDGSPTLGLTANNIESPNPDEPDGSNPLIESEAPGVSLPRPGNILSESGSLPLDASYAPDPSFTTASLEIGDSTSVVSAHQLPNVDSGSSDPSLPFQEDLALVPFGTDNNNVEPEVEDTPVNPNDQACPAPGLIEPYIEYPTQVRNQRECKKPSGLVVYPKPKCGPAIVCCKKPISPITKNQEECTRCMCSSRYDPFVAQRLMCIRIDDRRNDRCACFVSCCWKFWVSHFESITVTRFAREQFPSTLQLLSVKKCKVNAKPVYRTASQAKASSVSPPNIEAKVAVLIRLFISLFSSFFLGEVRKQREVEIEVKQKACSQSTVESQIAPISGTACS